MNHDFDAIFDELEMTIPNLREIAAPGSSLRTAVVILVAGSTLSDEATVSDALHAWWGGSPESAPSLDLLPGEDGTAHENLSRGINAHEAGRYADSIQLFMKAKELFLRDNDPAAAGMADMEIAMSTRELGWLGESKTAFQRAKTAVDLHGDYDDRARVALNYGSLLHDLEDHDSAFGQYSVARHFAREANSPLMEANATFNLGNIACCRGDLDDAMAAWAQAVAVYEELGDDRRVVSYWRSVGNLLSQQGRHDEAVPWLRDALAAYEDLGHGVEVASTRQMLAHPLHHLGEFAEAERLLRLAVAEFEANDAAPDHVHALTDLAFTLSARGSAEEGATTLERAFAVARERELTWFEDHHQELLARLRGGDEVHVHPDEVERSYFSSGFGEALALVQGLHREQVRKSATDEPSGRPYLGHLLGTAALVIEDGGSEAEAIAALLHDSIEDTATTIADIEAMFGDEVAAIVDGCSDADTIPKPPWRERKEAHIAHLEHATPAVLRVSCADKLYNARTILEDLRTGGETVWSRFTGGKEGTLWYYRTLADLFLRLRPGAMAEELGRVTRSMEEEA